MSSWYSYPSIYTLGHRAIRHLLKDEDGKLRSVNVEEKIDGSQFSFGLFTEVQDRAVCEETPHGFLRVRSKGAVMHPVAPEGMFKDAVAAVKARIELLHKDWTYRAEYLKKPKHNSLAYDRTPKDHLIIFDINDGEESYLSYEQKAEEAARIGFEVVPLLYSGGLDGIESFRKFLETTSILGGQKIEGVVVKPTSYDFFGTDKKVLLGKFVSEEFKEVHRRTWNQQEGNQTHRDVLQLLADRYTTPARWRKSVQHIRERGEIEDSPRDIGKILAEVPEDVLKECREEMMEDLFRWAWPHIRRGLTRGLPEWYKDQLLRKQFNEESANG